MSSITSIPEKQFVSRSSLLALKLKTLTSQNQFEGKPRSTAMKRLDPTLASVALYQQEFIALKHVKEQFKSNHIIDFYAGVIVGNEMMFLMPWADGGSILDLWAQNPTPQLCSSLVRDVVAQLAGLAEALEQMHRLNTEENPSLQRASTGDFNPRDGRRPQRSSTRHSDLKPDNILRFRTSHDKDGHVDIGNLKMADFGLAKLHAEATELNQRSGTISVTRRYAAPEAELNPDAARSRRYDIWSMGCVVFEFIVWMLYGWEEREIGRASCRERVCRYV